MTKFLFRKKLMAATVFVSALSTCLVLHPKAANAAGFCPVVGASSNCGTVITLSDSPGGLSTSILSTGIGAYDGSDDDLVGIVNNSTKSLASITLSGTGNGGGIFAFDGDGLCGYITCNYSHPTGYEGPLTTFSNTNLSGDTGTINFTGGLQPGTSTYFSLEGSPSSIQGNGGGNITVGGVQTNPPGGTPTTVPEPLTTFGTAVAGVLGLWLKRKKTMTSSAV